MLSNVQPQQFIYNPQVPIPFMDVRGRSTYVGNTQGSINHTTYSNNEPNGINTEQRYKAQCYDRTINNEQRLSKNESYPGNRYMIPAIQHRIVNGYSHPSNNYLVSVKSVDGSQNDPVYDVHRPKSVNNIALGWNTYNGHKIHAANNPAKHSSSSIPVHNKTNNNSTPHQLYPQNVSNRTTATMNVGKNFAVQHLHLPPIISTTGVTNNSVWFNLPTQVNTALNKYGAPDLILTPPPTPLPINHDNYTIEMFKNEAYSSKRELPNLQQSEDFCFLQPSNNLHMQTNNTESSIVPGYKTLLHEMAKNPTRPPNSHTTTSNKKAAMVPLKLRMKQSRKILNEIICISDSEEEGRVAKERNKELICKRKPIVLNDGNCHSDSHASNQIKQNDDMKYATPNMAKRNDGMLLSNSVSVNPNPEAHNTTNRDKECPSDNQQTKVVEEAISDQVCKTALTSDLLHDTSNQTKIDTHISATHTNLPGTTSVTNKIQNIQHEVPPQSIRESCVKNVHHKDIATHSIPDLLGCPNNILTHPEYCIINSNDELNATSKHHLTTETIPVQSIHPKKINLQRYSAQLQVTNKTESYNLKRGLSETKAETCVSYKSLPKFQKFISPIAFNKKNKKQSIFETLENEWNVSDEKIKSVFKKGRNKLKLLEQSEDKGSESLNSKAGVINQLPLLNTLINTGKKDRENMVTKEYEEMQNKLEMKECPTERNFEFLNTSIKSNCICKNEVYVSTLLKKNPSSFLNTIKSIAVDINAPVPENCPEILDPIELQEETVEQTSQVFHCEFGECNYSSVNKTHRDKHHLGHTIDMEFKCPICSFGFIEIWRVHAHMKKVHGIFTDNSPNEGRRRKSQSKQVEKPQTKEETAKTNDCNVVENDNDCKTKDVQRKININEYLDCFDQLLSDDDEFSE